jgi:beta-xylosidase
MKVSSEKKNMKERKNMKRIIVLTCLFCLASVVRADNPVITHMYTADPSARVFDGVLYLYPSHDRDSATWWDMVDWHVFSTTDMVNYTDHGVALSLEDISWAGKFAWAPDCVKKMDKYYFYYPTDQKHIGVAVSDKPCGPFLDPLGHPLISKDSPGVKADRDFIDPCAFIDDDGKAYLFMGQHFVNVIELNDDMISYNGKVHIVEGVPDFFEAVWVHKQNGKYYLSYSGKGRILYAMSDNILGPYEFKGTILQRVNSGTNHHSIVQFKGKWYLFYHTADLSRQKIPEDSKEWKFHKKRRSICVDELYYNPDGTIREVVMTKEGVPVVGE